MKSAALAFPLAVTLAGYLVSGCVTHKPVYVAPWGAQPVVDTTPAARDKVLGAPPGSHLTWSKGYWAFADWRWFWVPGHWEEHQPLASSGWVPGSWEDRNGQWIWHPGHWD